MANSEVPYFIRIRGCINCSASKDHKARHGIDYGFDHELQVGCLIRGCFDHGHTLVNPYFDPAEIIRMANKIGTIQAAENAKLFCQSLETQYGHFYHQIGISIEEILKNLEADKQTPQSLK